MMEPSYHFLDHDADMGIAVTAGDLLGVWDQSACALADVMTDASALRRITEQRIEITAPDLTAAWVESLAELLFYFEAEGLLLCGVERLEVNTDEPDQVRIELVARGELYDEDRHVSRTAVKAVTHHDAELRELPGGGWSGRVLLDL